MLWAQENPADLKDLAVAQIYEYAQSLYDRGNHEEAARAMGRLLQLNPDYAPALAYMRKLGYQPRLPVENGLKPLPAHTEPAPTVLIDPKDPDADLKSQLAAEDQALSTLNEEITQLHAVTQRISNE